jgi:hypothetical protein
MKKWLHIIFAGLVVWGCENTYMQDVLRDAALLTNINISPQPAPEINYALDPGFTPKQTSYTALVPFETRSITLSGTSDKKTVITYRRDADPESASGVFDFPGDMNHTRITVTASRDYMDSTVYTVAITRKQPPWLQNIILTAGTASASHPLVPNFNTDIMDYTAGVPSTTDSITVTGAAGIGATVNYSQDGGAQQPSGTFPFTGEVSLIRLHIRNARESEQILVYRLTVTRPRLVSFPGQEANFSLSGQEDHRYYQGEPVAFTVKPPFGCTIRQISYTTEGGVPVVLSPVADAYVFLMPPGAVKLKGEWTPIPASTDTRVRYVWEHGTGDGSSWARASGDLQAMIDAYLPGEEIWIAAGTVVPRWAWAEDPEIPEPSWARELSHAEKTSRLNWAFVLKDGVKISGGFAGTEITQADKAARNPEANMTILSGDFGSGNTSHVVLALGITGNTLLEDVKISGGASLVEKIIDLKINTWEVPVSCGGGVYTIACGRNLKFSRLLISGNAASKGGGMYNVNSSPTIDGGIISNNKAYYGGGVVNMSFLNNLSRCSPLFTGTIISGNQAEYSGGGVYNKYSVPVFDGVRISGNEGAEGGGFYSDSSIVTIRDTQINGNKSGYGGGLCCSLTHLLMTNVRIRNNSAKNSGGGMYLSGFSSFYEDEKDRNYHIMTNVEISGNSADSGGGIYMDMVAHLIMTNLTISGNKAGSGGPLSFAPYLSGQSQFYNSIIWGNTPANVEDKGMTNYYNTLVEGKGASNPGGFAGKASEVFEDPAAGNYRLKSASPAINAGNNSYYNAIPRLSDNNEPDDRRPVMDAPAPGPAVDLAGNKRINGVIDMGAYEK